MNQHIVCGNILSDPPISVKQAGVATFSVSDAAACIFFPGSCRPEARLSKSTNCKRGDRCGESRGSGKDGMVIIQGDHRDTVKSLLERQKYTVKLAGG